MSAGKWKPKVVDLLRRRQVIKFAASAGDSNVFHTALNDAVNKSAELEKLLKTLEDNATQAGKFKTGLTLLKQTLSALSAKAKKLK